MWNIRTILSCVGLLLSTILIKGVLASEKCATLESAGPGKLVEYLQGERSTLTDSCISFAIERLGQQRFSPASSTLVNYLDFKLPQPPPPSDRPIRVGPIRTVVSVYPAAGALFQIGLPSSPFLAGAIG